MDKEEFVELTVKIPKPVIDFFEAYWRFVGYTDQTAEQFLARRLAQDGQELVRCMVLHEITDDAEAIIEKYGLEPYREVMGFRKRKEAEAQ